MQLKRSGLAAGILFLAAWSCAKTTDAPTTGHGGTTTVPSANDSERVVQRCTERWKKVAAADWIEAYDYLTPQMRKTQSLPDYLMGKTNHKYEKPETPELLELQPERAFVYVACTWTPTHPALGGVKLDPGQTLTEHLELVETWHKANGEWYYHNSQSILEFFSQNPGVKRPTPRAPMPGG